MKEMKHDETQRRHTFIKYVGMTVLQIFIVAYTFFELPQKTYTFSGE